MIDAHRKTGWWHHQHGTFECRHFGHAELAEDLALAFYGQNDGPIAALLTLRKNEWYVWHVTPNFDETVTELVEPEEAADEQLAN